MNECDLSKCKHISDLEHELAEANAAHACCKVWADDARKQRDDAMEAGLDMLEVLTVKAAGGVYAPSEEIVRQWRRACTANAPHQTRHDSEMHGRSVAPTANIERASGCLFA